MLWFDRHRRLRDQLSVYIDGELDARAGGHLERHLTQCESCRLELEQLRATVSALQEMPAAEPSRSFTLSPEQVRAPHPPVPAPSPLTFGMRIAAAGVAAALAIVVVVDLGDFGGDGAGDEAAAPQMLAERAADEATGGAATGGAAATEEDAAPTEPDAGDAGEPGFGRTTMDDAADTPAPEAKEPAPTDKADTPEEAEVTTAASEDGGGGGFDALIFAEIGLAIALVVLIAGGFGLAFAGRKR